MKIALAAMLLVHVVAVLVMAFFPVEKLMRENDAINRDAE